MIGPKGTLSDDDNDDDNDDDDDDDDDEITSPLSAQPTQGASSQSSDKQTALYNAMLDAQLCIFIFRSVFELTSQNLMHISVFRYVVIFIFVFIM